MRLQKFYTWQNLYVNINWHCVYCKYKTTKINWDFKRCFNSFSSCFSCLPFPSAFFLSLWSNSILKALAEYNKVCVPKLGGDHSDPEEDVKKSIISTRRVTLWSTLKPYWGKEDIKTVGYTGRGIGAHLRWWGCSHKGCQAWGASILVDGGKHSSGVQGDGWDRILVIYKRTDQISK